VPGIPVGGVVGSAGVMVRAVSRGSCACPGDAATQRTATSAAATPPTRAARRVAKTEVVVVVSLTLERTVYFTL